MTVTLPVVTPDTGSERVALIVWRLTRGEALTTREIACLAGTSRQGALQLLSRISRVIPLYQDDQFVWQIDD